ncbi:NAD(P)-binding domain-containing protein [Saccharothrix sp. AJ9571]|nr:NAD(P)-binding domain-containing protein [Saccharothrix sp. AJ9571]
MTNRHVTVLGLGKMGEPIAATLLAAGHRTTVWNRSAAKADALVARGAQRAGTVAEAVAAGEVVIASLLDAAAVREVLTTADLTGRTLVNVTTSGPDDARELAGWATERGAAYLDGAMMAVPQTLGTPDALLLYSGSSEAFEGAKDVLELLGTTKFLGEEPALAEFYDLALLSAGYSTLAGFLHATALLRTVGVAPGEMLPLLDHWLGGMIAFMPELAGEIETGEYAAGVSSVDLNRSALRHIVEVSRASGIDPALQLPIQDLLERRAADGHGGDSFSSLVEVLTKV